MNPVTAAAPPAAPPAGWLPRADSVLVVLARPGQESADLGAWAFDLGTDAGTARAIAKAAAGAHESQSSALPQLIARLDRLGRREHLRWLVTPAWARRVAETQEETCPTAHWQPATGTGRRPLTVVTSRSWRRADTSW